MDAALFTEVVVPTFATLFVIIDPLGLMPIFLGLTAGMTQSQRRVVAVRSCTTAIAVLAVFALFGDNVLGFLGIGMPAFRIAGGLMLFLIAVEMLFEKRTERRNKNTEEAHHDGSGAGAADDVAIFPLAIPLLAGPGSIASIILLTSSHQGNYLAQGAVIGVMLGVMAISFVMFVLAGRLEKLTGPTFTKVVTRLFGIILGALAVQFVLSGLAGSGLMAQP